MSDATTVCEGCDRERDVRAFKMEYGGVERLCTDCVRQSHRIIVREVPNVDPCPDCGHEFTSLRDLVAHYYGEECDAIDD